MACPDSSWSCSKHVSLALLALAACSSDPATPAIDAGSNPAQVWLAGINGSEINLQLVDTGPPSPF